MQELRSPYSAGRLDAMNNRAHRCGANRRQLHQLFTPQQQRDFVPVLRSVNQITATKTIEYPLRDLRPVNGRWMMVKEFRLHVLDSDNRLIAESNYIVIADADNLKQYLHGLQDGLLKNAYECTSHLTRASSVMTTTAH